MYVLDWYHFGCGSKEGVEKNEKRYDCVTYVFYKKKLQKNK